MRIEEIPEAKKVIIETPVQRKNSFQPWEVRRVKYHSLLWEVVSKGDKVFIDIGYLSGGNAIGQSAECIIIEIEPPINEVQITPKTKIELKYKLL